MNLLKVIVVLTSVLLSFASCKQPSMLIDNQVSLHLDALIAQKEVFKARNFFENHKHELILRDSLIFAAKIESYFNKSEQSNNSITHLFTHYSNEINDTLKSDLLRIKHHNHVKLFEYEQAAGTINELIDDYIEYLDSTELAELRNELSLWEGLKDELPQKLVRKEYTEIELVQGSRIPTFLNGSNTGVDMVFDTGANMSLIIESLADSMHIKYLNSSVRVKGILGNEIAAKVGVASSMTFGNIEFNNVVLLVFPDRELYFEEADFQIYGIIGYPVISALGEIQRTRQGKLIVPSETSESSYSNLALDYLTPLIEVISEDDSLVFTFDTGAGETWIFKDYFDKNEDAILSASKKSEVVLGGVGAVNRYQVYRFDFPYRIGNSSSVLESATIFDQKVNVPHEDYSGNLGQDIVNAFDKMTLNFDSMFIEFSNED